jgi:hypothetical protein
MKGGCWFASCYDAGAALGMDRAGGSPAGFAILRLGAPGVTEFRHDEANLSQLALDLARGRDLPLLSINSSVGVPNSLVSVYLFALPYLLDDTPVLATLFVGPLNVIAVALTWTLARRYYGPVATAVVGLLYAASPWAVIYSRKSGRRTSCRCSWWRRCSRAAGF